MSIVIDSPVEAVRRRPGMYVGDVRDGSGLLHLVWEVLANAIDEHTAGHCREVSITIDDDGSITIDDDGRGIRVDETEGVSFLQDALTRYHPTPTLDGHAPHEHVGIHGAGVFVVNALSTWLEVESRRDGLRHRQRYERGVPTGRLEVVGPASRPGTTISFRPDPGIFDPAWVDADRLGRRLRELAALFPSLTLSLLDRRRHVFHAPTGLAALLPPPRRGASTVGRLELGELADGIRVDAVLEWRENDEPAVVESYANLARTSEGGTHVAGLLKGLALGLHDQPGWTRLPLALARAVVSRGLVAVVRVRLADPTFDGPTRDKLDTREVGRAVSHVVRRTFAGAFQGDEAMQERWRRAQRRRL